MHILFLTDNFPPEVNAPASRTYEHAREWVKLGHRVTIVTCAPNFPKGKVFDGYRNRLWQRETMDGIEVIRVWSYITSNEGFAKRIADYVSYMATAILASFFVRRPDVVIGTSPQFFAAVGAWIVAALKRRPFVFELRDIWPESIRAVGAMKGTRVLDGLEKLELFLYRRARMVVTVTHAFKENLTQRGIDPDKIVVVRNGVDLTRFQPMKKETALIEALGLKDRFTVGYIGTHGMAHALTTLLDAARILRDRHGEAAPQFLFVGDGAEKQNLVQRADQLGLKNVTFVESQERSEMPRYWSILDATVIHLRKTDLFKTVIPSKMFECFAMGVPILHGVEGESAQIIAETGAGLTFEAENAAALADRIEALNNNPELAKNLGDQGIANASRFDRVRLAHDMLQEIEELKR